MEQKSVEYLTETLSNWSTVHVRTVPGVMYQVLCTKNSTDNNIEYRFHWFLDCTETHIHNHRYTFNTFCLEGEYEEKLWEIIHDDSDTTTYQFPRTSGNKLGPMVRLAGVLRNVASRHHFPGNILHVKSNQFHSISPITQSNNHVVTFVARQICPSVEKHTYILSPSESIEAPIEEIRLALSEERLDVYHKLRQILQGILYNDEFESCFDPMKKPLIYFD